MNNIIINDIFSKQELIKINQCINNSLEKEEINYYFGRMNKGFELDQDIINKINKIPSDNGYSDLILIHYGYSIYSKLYGLPKLPPHIDQQACEFTIDFQLESNIDWSVIVENNEFYLKDNSALIFSGENQLHWRPKINFNDKNYLKMIFFHFSKKDHWFLTDNTFLNQQNILKKEYEKLKNMKKGFNA